MRASNFASRTFAYKRLAQGLSRDLSAFSSFMRDYLDGVMKADQCDQYVDDFGIAANDATTLITNPRATFECIREGGLKLTMHKCHFGATEIDFLGRTITPKETNYQLLGKKRNSRSPRRSYNVILATSIITGTINQDYSRDGPSDHGTS